MKNLSTIGAALCAMALASSLSAAPAKAANVYQCSARTGAAVVQCCMRAFRNDPGTRFLLKSADACKSAVSCGGSRDNPRRCVFQLPMPEQKPNHGPTRPSNNAR